MDGRRLPQGTFPPVHFVSCLVADASSVLRGHLVPFFFLLNMGFWEAVPITLKIFALVSIGTAV